MTPEKVKEALAAMDFDGLCEIEDYLEALMDAHRQGKM